MAQELLYSTTFKLRGPWLLEGQQLLALDGILEEFCPGGVPPVQGQGPAIGPAVPHVEVKRKSLTVFLSKERELKTSSFKEAISHIGSQNDVAEGFEYVAQIHGITASILLRRKSGEKEDGPRFELTVGPPSKSESYNIFVKLKDWADGVAAPLWQQWILFEIRPLCRFALSFVLIILMAMLFNTASSASEYKEAVKVQARTLLQSGINQQNQARALELLLALESDSVPPGTKPKQTRKPIAWYLIALYVFAFLSFTPTICLGMWSGKRRLRWWNLWMKFNTVTVPALILARWVYPQLFSTLETLLRS